MALTDIATIKTKYEPGLSSMSDAALQLALDAAEALLARDTGLPVNQTTYTRRFNGADAAGKGRDTLYLADRHRPVIHSGGDLVTVTEDGTSIVVALGYSATADVILHNANEELPCSLVRNGTVWSDAAPDNVAVTYKAGWTSVTVPADVEFLICEMAWLIFKSPRWTGVASVSKGPGSVSFEKELSPIAQAVLARLRGL